MKRQPDILKNQKIKESYLATKAKRESQVCKVFTVKIQKNHLNQTQKEALKLMFLEAKWMYNHILNLSQDENNDIFKLTYKDLETVIHFDKDKNKLETKLSYLSSQMKQGILEQLLINIKSLNKAKKKGLKVGALKFISEYKSINLKQAEISYKIVSKNKIKIQGIKKPLKVNGLKQILNLKDYDLANAKLINNGLDYYIAITVYTTKQSIVKPIAKIGIDMGCETSFTLSNGEKISYRFEESEYIKYLQRKISKCKKGSKNRYKLRLKLKKANLKLTNQKQDAANKLIHYLSNYIVVIQDEQLQNWKRMRHGKAVQHGILGRVKSKLKNNDNTIVLNKFVPTTKFCRNCGRTYDIKLKDRIFKCPYCGTKEDRDIHAAKNMLWFEEKNMGVGHTFNLSDNLDKLRALFPQSELE